MPITKSAKKLIRVSSRKKVFNDARKKTMKDAIKNIEKMVASGKKADAVKMLPGAYQAVDKAARANVINKNNAGRKKSRLAKLLAPSN